MGGGILIDRIQVISPDFKWLTYQINALGISGVVFAGVPFILLGRFLLRKKLFLNIGIHRLANITIIILILGFCEAVYSFHRVGNAYASRCSLFNWLPAIPVFIISFLIPLKKRKCYRMIRKLSDLVYIVHPWILEILWRFFHIKNMQRFLICLVLSYGSSLVGICMIRKIKFFKDSFSWFDNGEI